MVIELRSAGDETYAKLDWHGRRGVDEVVVIEPVSRQVELFVLAGAELRAVQPDAEGDLRSAVLGRELRTVDGPLLRVTWDDCDVSI